MPRTSPWRYLVDEDVPISQTSIAEIHNTLNRMTARYMRDCPVSIKRSSNLKALAKKEKEINATKME